MDLNFVCHSDSYLSDSEHTNFDTQYALAGRDERESSNFDDYRSWNNETGFEGYSDRNLNETYNYQRNSPENTCYDYFGNSRPGTTSRGGIEQEEYRNSEFFMASSTPYTSHTGFDQTSDSDVNSGRYTTELYDVLGKCDEISTFAESYLSEEQRECVSQHQPSDEIVDEMMKNSYEILDVFMKIRHEKFKTDQDTDPMEYIRKRRTNILPRNSVRTQKM
ncbi:hypothetical protein AX774_g1113 [Zancudomyces culisetae]|uniref:Uncharacterized protein n=1 Tax=Zancudomyces culisetae TaxID=1213189 RepID=A0A1R1PJV6_ZANCU|nr:hypothetical protein AX774_g5293 [Zancudomyces culisetae]OMH85358.1 hypothetical protein AX774_g1113 [Zancudomyces culisetae]|eukprot:OMH81248.1 hypothetical protein AX774_g5293 [Zancudomyces culisetae]